MWHMYCRGIDAYADRLVTDMSMSNVLAPARRVTAGSAR